MATKFDQSKLGDYTRVSLIGAYNRCFPYPIDDSSIWVETDDEGRPILEQMERYASSKTNNSYVGQRLTYITAAGDITHYTIVDEDGTLRADAKFDYDEDTLTLDIYV